MDDPRVPNSYGVIPEDEALDLAAMSTGRTGVRDTWFVFDSNATEWLKYEAWLNEGANHLTFWSSELHPSELLREPGRRLHNFLASAASLVDHTRNHIRRVYRGHGFEDRYQAEVERCFLDKPLPRFIGDLRNFALRHHLPLHAASLSLTIPPRHAFLLRRDAQLESYEWKALPARFLRDGPESIEVSPLVSEYRATVARFRTWREEQEQSLFHRGMEAQHGPNSPIARRARGEEGSIEES